ncbi:MAG: hypothetical protein PHN89_01565 [Candidatus Pacebacteria bacterium]|nr:hypothetical protein [Candidatus Paceibacterota bacterium]
MSLPELLERLKIRRVDPEILSFAGEYFPPREDKGEQEIILHKPGLSSMSGWDKQNGHKILLNRMKIVDCVPGDLIDMLALVDHKRTFADLTYCVALKHKIRTRSGNKVPLLFPSTGTGTELTLDLVGLNTINPCILTIGRRKTK